VAGSPFDSSTGGSLDVVGQVFQRARFQLIQPIQCVDMAKHFLRMARRLRGLSRSLAM
jgi:hypothetical protein